MKSSWSKDIFVDILLSPKVFSTKGVFDEVNFRRKNSVPKPLVVEMPQMRRVAKMPKRFCTKPKTKGPTIVEAAPRLNAKLYASSAPLHNVALLGNAIVAFSLEQLSL